MAKKFKFNLQSVLNLREFKRDLLRQDLANIMVELNNEKVKLSCLVEEFERNRDRLMEELLNNDNSKTIFYYRDYLNFLEKKIADERRIVEILEEAVLKKRKEIGDAEKEKKVVEKIKERKLDRYESDMKSKLQKNADEFSIQRFNYEKRSAV
ncbi:MAG: flagellar export protein FliJ [Actinobacteria bacterium]|nr:flagellar export protein FliJ [Actinomycetota bacterium]